MATYLEKLIEGTDLHIIENTWIGGFDNWQQVEDFCKNINKQYNCDWFNKVAEPVILHCRRGQRWNYKCDADAPFFTDWNNICESLNAVNAFPKKDNPNNEKLLEEEYYPLIEGLDDDDDANEINEIKERVDIYCQQLEELKENQVLVIFDGGGYDIEEMSCLRYSYDVHNYMIAVQVELPEEESEEE